jgi:hypothetical protein
MPVKRSQSRLLVVLLALPVIATVYVAFFGRRATSVGRSVAAGLLGATVIGSIYAEVAARTALVPARRAPLPLTLAAALALVLVTSGLPTATPARAANSQADNVVDAALAYLGAPYVWGAEGPNAFDCSGLVYRAFKDAGELPLISGERRTAAGYYRYFANRGLTSKTDGRRGDLVIYGGGTHIGIYLGDGKVVSAITKGVSIHGINALSTSFTTFLNVDWTPESETMTTTEFVSNVPADLPDEDTTDEDGQATEDTDSSNTDGQAAAIATGFASGSMNLRVEPAPGMEIIGYVSRGTTFEILATGHSPGGALWYKVRKTTGKEGWVWSHWADVIDGSVDK